MTTSHDPFLDSENAETASPGIVVDQPSGSSGATGDDLELPIDTAAIMAAVEASEAVPYLHLVESFVVSQREILRLASYVSEREKEIDDPRSMALAAVKRSHPGSGHEHFDALWLKTSEMTASLVKLERGEFEAAEFQVTLQQSMMELFRKVPEDHGPAYVYSMMRASVSQPSSPRLYSSLLSAIIGDFEVLVAGLARLLVSKHPQILGSADRKYDWKEISAFASLEDFRQDVIDKSVDQLLFESFTGWVEFFRDKCHLNVPSIADGFELLEVFQRRHVVIHNGGLVSRQYVEKLKKHGKTEEVGARLPVDAEYLKRAADALCILGTSLVGNAANNFIKDAEEKRQIERAMGNYPFELIQDGRFVAAYGIACEQNLDKYSNDYTALVVTVNRWLALKRLNRLDECREEIECWQTSSLAETFQLARLALLDDMEPAYEIVQRIRGTKALPFAFWLQWPLLEELRAYEFELTKSRDVISGHEAADGIV